MLQTYFLQAYQNVVKLAPQHFEARRALSNILNKLGRPEEALHTLTQDEKVELVSKELNHLAAILHVYAGGLNFMKQKKKNNGMNPLADRERS